MGRKPIYLIVCLVLALFLAGCGSPEAPAGQNPEPSISLEPRERPNLVDQGDYVEITFPAEVFEGVELSDEFLEVNNYLAGAKHADGSVTISMTKERHDSFLTAIKDTVDYNIDYFKEELDYLVEIKYAEDFSWVEIYVQGDIEEAYLRELPYFFSLPFEQYQQMQGEIPQVTTYVINSANNTELLKLVFPDDE